MKKPLRRSEKRMDAARCQDFHLSQRRWLDRPGSAAPQPLYRRKQNRGLGAELSFDTIAMISKLSARIRSIGLVKLGLSASSGPFASAPRLGCQKRDPKLGAEE